MTWIWLGLVVTLFLIEIITTKLVTIWYVVSAIVSMFLSMFINNYFIEFIVFIVLGTVLLFTTKSYLIKFIDKIKNNILGKEAIVIKEINKNSLGKIKFNGIKHIAISNKKISKNKKVTIIDIQQGKFVVEELKR